VVLETLAVLGFFLSHATPNDEQREEKHERERKVKVSDESRTQDIGV